MSTPPPSTIATLADYLASLEAERERLWARLREIEEIGSRAAKMLGIEVPKSPDLAASLPRLERPHPKHVGSLGERMLEILLNAESGYLRPDLKRDLMADPKFAERINHNPNSFYNVIGRYLAGGKIVEINNHLFHPQRAPVDSADAASERPGLRLVSHANGGSLFETGPEAGKHNGPVSGHSSQKGGEANAATTT